MSSDELPETAKMNSEHQKPTGKDSGMRYQVSIKMDGAKYRKILEENVLNSAENLRSMAAVHHCKHTARAAIDWFKPKQIYKTKKRLVSRLSDLVEHSETDVLVYLQEKRGSIKY